MKGLVKKLFDVDSVEIPAEMLAVSIDEKCADEALERLSLRCAKEETVECVEMGDIVYCKADESLFSDNRTVLIYTSVMLPGAETAAKDVLGKKLYEIVETELCEKETKLKIEKIIHRTLATVDDSLIMSLGIEGVDSIEAYREYIKAKTVNAQKTEKVKEINHFVIKTIVDNSEFEYDEDETLEFAKKEYQKYLQEFGEEMLGESEDAIVDSIIFQLKQSWYCEAFCKQRGIEIDMQAVEMQADQMLEMMSLMGQEVPDREEMLETEYQNECATALFAYIEGKTSEKMGG